MSIIFGPVHSRRFGKSLGIDLSPSKKQCNFDCLYCELEPAKTMDSYESVVSIEEIIDALKVALAKHHDIDFITLTANGEPTLYPHLSQLIDAIDSIKGDIKTLILSNGSTIASQSVVKALLKLDSVKLSLDCATQKCLQKLDRSHQGITIDSIMQGMLDFKKLYHKPLIIETLFVKRLNDKDEELRMLNAFFLRLQPTRIDIGTIDRPPAYRVESLDYQALYKISQFFDASLPVYIASRKKVLFSPENYSERDIIETLAKRPLTPDDIEVLFNNESKKRLEKLVLVGKIEKKEENGIIFYILCKKA